MFKSGGQPDTKPPMCLVPKRESHKSESGATEETHHVGEQMCVKSVVIQCLPVGVVARKEGYQLRCRPQLSTEAQNCEIRHQ
ncbi:hypothetical protein TNCV_2979141 [Trichonephila clavipes]|nr:hypothetical protein TNCV_2979141 [Trichonephila clavipes]